MAWKQRRCSAENSQGRAGFHQPGRYRQIGKPTPTLPTMAEPEKTIFNLFGRLVLFRPDLYQHRVSQIERENRWLLSFALNRPPTP